MSGFDILTEMRKKGIGTPILMLTARGELNDRLRGFEQGADDYLATPFALPELLARVRALLNRARPVAGSRLRVADLEIDLISRRATRGGRLIDLAPKELELLVPDEQCRQGGVPRDARPIRLGRFVTRHAARQRDRRSCRPAAAED